LSRIPSPATTLRLLALVSAAACAYRALDILRAEPARFDTAMAWDCAALVLAASVLLIGAPRTRSNDRARTTGIDGRIAVGVVLAILGAAVFMRLYGFGTVPATHGTGFEENQAGGVAYRILEDEARPIEFAFTNYTAAAGFALFGYDTLAMRLPFLVAGIASVAALFLLLRQLVSLPAALFVAALFAACRWQAFTVRFADELFFGANLAIAAALLLVVVLRSGNRYAVIGLALATGALSYEYVSYRLVPYLIVGALLVAAVLKLRQLALAYGWAAAMRRLAGEHALPAVVFTLVMFVVMTPLLAATPSSSACCPPTGTRNSSGRRRFSCPLAHRTTQRCCLWTSRASGCSTQSRLCLP
jgi:hypothetical protein